MSVATDLVPIVDIPQRARRSGAPVRTATVTVLHRPAEHELTPPLRLTRRGSRVLAIGVALVAIALVWFARASAPSGPGAPPHVPDVVTVHAGDSLWSIASRLAPQGDPSVEVAQLQRLNGLTGAALVPGQVLRTH